MVERLRVQVLVTEVVPLASGVFIERELGLQLYIDGLLSRDGFVPD